MRRWTHDVSAEWLKARRLVLTATEVSSLVPEYKRALKKSDPGKILPGFAALWASKKTDSELDTSSPSPAAARGHIMEPWAIASWNAQVAKMFNHWDDCIICNDGLGFSPDGMDVPQVWPSAILNVSDDGKFLQYGDEFADAPTEVMEVKSYEPPKHMKSVIADRLDHDELVQLAVPFVVLPELKCGRMLWFCPDAPISMHTERYSKDDLAGQIELVEGIKAMWKEQCALCDQLHSTLKAQCTEQEVWEAFVAEQSEESGEFILRR